MKLNVFAGLVLLAVAIQKGESTLIRTAIEQVLEVLNTASGKLANDANNYLLEKMENVTEVEEWSVNTQVKVFTGVVKVAFSVFNVFYNSSIVEVKLLDCMAAEETTFLANFTQAAINNGLCNNVLAGNLTRAFQGVTKIMVARNEEFRNALDSLESCIWGDDICFTKYATEIAAYVKSESMVPAIEEVIRILYGMYLVDAPTCNKDVFFPEIADCIHDSFINIYNCVIS